MVGLRNRTYWDAFQITSSRNLAVCHWHLSKIFENVYFAGHQAPIIILKIKVLPAPDNGAHHTFSGLKKQADHDSLINQADKPIFTRAAKSSLLLCLVIRRDLDDATSENHRQRPLQVKKIKIPMVNKNEPSRH
jgi:hypothetical protein